MTEAFVYDAIRTPRGKGKKDGALHEVKPVSRGSSDARNASVGSRSASGFTSPCRHQTEARVPTA